MQCNIDNCDGTKPIRSKNSTGSEVEIKEEVECKDLIKNEYIEMIPFHSDDKSDCISYEHFKLKNEELHLKLECNYDDDTDQSTNLYEKLDVGNRISSDKSCMDSVDKQKEHEVNYLETNELKYNFLDYKVDSITNQMKQYEFCHSSNRADHNDDDYKHIFGANSLIQHNIKNASQIFKCKHCTYETRYKRNLTKHIKGHENIKDFKCTLCSKEFAWKIDLDNHLLKIHKCADIRKKLYNCDQCNCEYLRKGDLLRHKIKHGMTDGIPILKCSQCTYETYHKRNLVSHVKIHQSIKDFKCSYCSKEFTQKNNLEIHLLRIHKCRDIRRKLYKCDQCSSDNLTKSDLFQHKIKHGITDGILILKCFRCTFETYHKKNLIRHVKIHQNIKDFKCSYCSKKFIYKCNLDCHLLTVHKCKNIRKKSYNCDQCSYKCMSKRDLSQHKVKHGVTDGIPILKCNQCTFETYRRNNFTKHVKVHKNIKDFKCTYCSKEFSLKANLEHHLISIHQCKDVKKTLYKCDRCSCEYLRKRDLLHHRIKHGITDGIPILKCYLCTYKTYRKSNLMTHVKIHKNIKDFKCTYCSKEFTQKYNLERHLTIHKYMDVVEKVYN